MRALVWDSETNGMILWKEPSDHPGQPHLVQLGALLVDMDTGREISSVEVIVRPDGWEIPAEVAAIHGITTEMAMDVGIPEKLALDMLLQLRQCAALHICHNAAFDGRIARIAIHRLGAHLTPDEWSAYPSECTMQMSTPILKLPSANGRGGHKWPKLTEAYKHFTGKELVGAHSAMVDVRGCLAVYRAIRGFPAPLPAPQGSLGPLTPDDAPAGLF